MQKPDKLISPDKPTGGKKWPLDHVAMIMDGNRRWADSKHLPRLAGHKTGVNTLKDLVRHVGEGFLPYLTVYAFSSENWNRSQEEVDYLLELFGQVITESLEELAANKVRLRFIGDLDNMPGGLKQSFTRAMKRTQDNTGLNLQVAINYGSRLEITQAAKRLVADALAGKIKESEIDEVLLNSYLYTSEIPDPDLIIRTGGEMRLSNYLLWQAAYSELYITPVLWPEFSPSEFDKAIEEFARRNRRYGGD